jgi:hypothetical protein
MLSSPTEQSMEWRSLVDIKGTLLAKYVWSEAIGALDICCCGGAD